MSKNATVGTFPASELARLFGGLDQIEIRKSAREGARYPLYLSTPRGPVHVNTAQGQDMLLELGTFKGASNTTPEPVPAKPAEPPKPAPEPAPVPAKPPEQEKKKASFWDF